MKKLIAIILFVIGVSMEVTAQEQTPQLLKQPADWQFERFALPPEFAPNFPYKGVEELRFSPGMFAKDSNTYFSYAFVAELDHLQSISEDQIKTYLLEYFKGLCASTAKARNLSIDISKITASVERNKNSASELIYNAVTNIFGVFADGAPVKLNMEIKVLTNKATSKLYLVVIASPHEKTDAVWNKLYTIRKEFVMP